jgi:hypothetical protein
MRVHILLVCIVLLALATVTHATRSTYATGKILDVRQRTRDRILLYDVNTPIMSEEPYITISLAWDGAAYEAEFLPRNFREIFPSLWKSEQNVLVRRDKHFLYLKREDGSEAKFLITGKARLQPGQESH